MSDYHELQDDDDRSNPKLHFLMFPWLAYGHITPYLHLSNELAKRGHKITFLSPASDKAKHRLQAMNQHPTLITFIPLPLPHVSGLPPAAETTADIPIEQGTLLATAFDLTRPKVEEIISQLQPDFVLYDFAYWIPDITSNLIGIKSVCYHVISAKILALNINRKPGEVTPPQGYPSSKVWTRGKHEMRCLMFAWQEFGGKGLTLHHRVTSAMKNSDVVALRTCREVEGKFCDYLSLHLDHRPVLLTGPVLPPPDLDNNTEILDERWAQWLGQFKDGEVVYCAFGSQSCFDRKQLEEILLGLEMTGLPFFAALAPPQGFEKIEDVLPEGFTERVLGRGVVYGGWVKQPALLSHPSVGCFVNHCGFGAMWEGIRSDCRLVLAPQLQFDHILNTRHITEEMGMAVEVQRDEDNGWISRESLCNAVKIVMDEGSQVGDMVRKNHAKWRQRLAAEGFMEGYVDDFIKSLEGLLRGN